jgi:importin subunit beta-1
LTIQAIEFWSTICDEEMDLTLEAEEVRESGQEPTRLSQAYADGALPHLCPKLTILLTQQDDDTNTDEWSPSKAAGVCLMNLGKENYERHLFI